jgi:hypothetical protein
MVQSVELMAALKQPFRPEHAAADRLESVAEMLKMMSTRETNISMNPESFEQRKRFDSLVAT